MERYAAPVCRTNELFANPRSQSGGDRRFDMQIYPFGDMHGNKPRLPSVLPNVEMLEAIALQNESLYKREKSYRQLAERLYEVGCLMFQISDLEELYHHILAYLAEFIPYDRAAIMLKAGDEMVVAASRGFPTAMADHSLLNVSARENNVFQHICQDKQPLLIPDVWQYPDWQQVADLPPGRTWLGIPLMDGPEVIGILSISRKRSKAYMSGQIRLVAKFAEQAAIAFKNAQAQDGVINFARQLKETVLDRSQALQTAYAQLEYLDETKADFVSIASHELRTPLTTLRGYSQILLQNDAVKENAHLSELISTIHSSTMRLHELINAMLDVAKIDSQTLELYREPVSLASLVGQVVKKFEKPLAERQHQLQVIGLDDMPLIEVDVEGFDKVFGDLISNAIKYTPDGGSITISGAYHRAEEKIEIVVSDTGIGIDPQFHELIFTKFYRADDLALHSTGKTKFKGAGPGLGLTIARGIVEMHQGRIWVESPGYDEKTCPGSQFHIVLPLH